MATKLANARRTRQRPQSSKRRNKTDEPPKTATDVDDDDDGGGSGGQEETTRLKAASTSIKVADDDINRRFVCRSQAASCRRMQLSPVARDVDGMRPSRRRGRRALVI